jgi:hypothetical protein
MDEKEQEFEDNHDVPLFKHSSIMQEYKECQKN